MKTAADRREKQREKGVTIHYGRLAWKRLGRAKRDRFDLGRNALAWIGPRWDANRDFGWYDDESGGQHLDHLFCFETANAAPKTSGPTLIGKPLTDRIIHFRRDPIRRGNPDHHDPRKDPVPVLCRELIKRGVAPQDTVHVARAGQPAWRADRTIAAWACIDIAEHDRDGLRTVKYRPFPKGI